MFFAAAPQAAYCFSSFACYYCTHRCVGRFQMVCTLCPMLCHCPHIRKIYSFMARLSQFFHNHM